MKGFKKMETDIKKPVGQVHWLFSRPAGFLHFFTANFYQSHP